MTVQAVSFTAETGNRRKSIRIFNGREIRIDNSVTREAVRHHILAIFQADETSGAREYVFYQF